MRWLGGFMQFLAERWSHLAVPIVIAYEPGAAFRLSVNAANYPICGCVGLFGLCLINSVVVCRLTRASSRDDMDEAHARHMTDLEAMIKRAGREAAEGHADFLAKMRSINREGDGWKRGERS